jgi:hypothetical protein
VAITDLDRRKYLEMFGKIFGQGDEQKMKNFVRCWRRGKGQQLGDDQKSLMKWARVKKKALERVISSDDDSKNDSGEPGAQWVADHLTVLIKTEVLHKLVLPVVATDDGQGDEVWFEPDEDTWSSKQMQRVTLQASCVLQVLCLLVKRAKEFLAILQGFEEQGANLDVAWAKEEVDAHTRKTAMPMIYAEVAALHNESVSAPTIAKYYNEFKTNKFCGWEEDGRGKFTRPDVLDDILGLRRKFTLFMMTSKDLSVDVAKDFLTKELTKFLAERDTAKDNSQPYEKVAALLKGGSMKRATAHRWMLACKAEYVSYKQNYFTDRHEDPANVYDREHRNLPEYQRLNTQRACWFEAELSKVSPEALKDLRRHLGIAAGEAVTKNVRVDAVTQEQFVMVHVDFLREDAHGEFRARMLKETGKPGHLFWYVPGSTGPDTNMPQPPGWTPADCRYKHDEQVCKCHLPLLVFGQDESVFKANMQKKKLWSINGRHALRPKSDGQGTMFACWVTDVFGMGEISVSEDELAGINNRRAMRGREPLSLKEAKNCTVRCLPKIGNGVWWTSKEMNAACQDILDVMSISHPQWQICMEVDASMGHFAKKEGGLDATPTALGLGYGGKKTSLRDAVVTASCLGDMPGKSLEAGARQSLVFEENDTPMHFFKNKDPIPLSDYAKAAHFVPSMNERPMTPEEVNLSRAKVTKKVAKAVSQ